MHTREQTPIYHLFLQIVKKEPKYSFQPEFSPVRPNTALAAIREKPTAQRR